MTNIYTDALPHRPGLDLGTAPFSLKMVAVGLLKALRAQRQRRQLAELTDAQLDDIGLSRGQAMAEAQRPVWDQPTLQPDPKI